jgi:hypothetical protein
LPIDAQKSRAIPGICNLLFLVKVRTFVSATANIDANRPSFAWWALGIIVCALVMMIRLRLLGIPLERDEGEYAYAGQLMLQGIPPYKLAYNMKFPGTYGAYALIMALLGQTIVAVHLGLLFVNAATIILIYFLGQRLAGTPPGIVAAATYAVLSVSPNVLGLAGHATHFVMLPTLAGLLLLTGSPGSYGTARLFASGICFGLALLMKQPAVFLIFFGATYFVFRAIRYGSTRKQMLLGMLIFAGGAICPLAITCLVLWHVGVFRDFWFWTIAYARQYGSLIPIAQAPGIFVDSLREVIGVNWVIWALAGFGAVAGAWNRRTRAATFFSIGLLFFATLALLPGFHFRYHYFVLILPAIALLAGITACILADLIAKQPIAAQSLVAIIFGAILVWPIIAQRRCLIESSPLSVSSMIYPEGPFTESLKIAEYLRSHTSPQDTIAVLGSEPQIYFYAQRHSATGYIYTYGLMEPQKYARQMQEQMIREIERSRPKYLVSVVMNDSWLPWPQSDRRIFAWANQYTAKNYDVTGFVNIRNPGESDYFFGEIPLSVPRLKNYILIYQRKL